MLGIIPLPKKLPLNSAFVDPDVRCLDGRCKLNNVDPLEYLNRRPYQNHQGFDQRGDGGPVFGTAVR
jgi:hypothetical protein